MSNDKFFGDIDDVSVAETASEAPVEVEVTTSAAEEKAPAAVDTTVKAADVGLTHTALGIHLNESGRYQVVKVKYDPVSGKSGGLDAIGEPAMDKMSAEELFKLSVVREGVFLN